MAHSTWSSHRRTNFVQEKSDDGTVVWEGPVDLFALAGHKKGENCYGWHHTKPDGTVKLLAVVESELVDSAEKAIEAAIYMDAQPVTPNEASALWKARLGGTETRLRAAQITSEDLHAAIEELEKMRQKIERWRTREKKAA